MNLRADERARSRAETAARHGGCGNVRVTPTMGGLEESAVVSVLLKTPVCKIQRKIQWPRERWPCSPAYPESEADMEADGLSLLFRCGHPEIGSAFLWPKDRESERR